MPTAKSFCVTISPRNGCSDKNIAECIKYCKKQEYAIIYREFREDGSPHLHIQLWYSKEKHTGDVNKSFIRICERTIDDWDANQKKFAVLTKCAADDWYLNYLENVEKKGEVGECLFSNEPDSTDEFYPDDDELEIMKKKKDCVDHRYNRLEDLFNEWKDDDEPITKGTVAKFLNWAEFEGRKIPVMKDKITALNTCTNLFYYINKNAGMERYMNKEDIALQEIYDEHLLV